MQLHPLADRLVARPVEAETKTASGILLADTAKQKTQLAEVLAVGKDVKEVKAGDRVLHNGKEYGDDAPIHFTQDRVEYIVLKEADLLAVVKEGK